MCFHSRQAMWAAVPAEYLAPPLGPLGLLGLLAVNCGSSREDFRRSELYRTACCGC